MKKILLTFSILLLATSCSKPATYADILGQDKDKKTSFETHVRYENDMMNVFGNAIGYKTINIKVTRKGNLVYNKDLPVSLNGYFQTYIENLRKDDKLCVQEANCIDL